MIFDLLSPSILIFSVDKIFIRVGNNVNVITKDVIKPKDIIQPKSITGFISLKIKDKNAQIVVDSSINYWPKHFTCCHEYNFRIFKIWIVFF